MYFPGISTVRNLRQAVDTAKFLFSILFLHIDDFEINGREAKTLQKAEAEHSTVTALCPAFCYIKNFAKSLLPKNAPINRNRAKTQPDSDKDAMLENSAPMLQPPARRAP